MTVGMFIGWSSPVIQKLQEPEAEIQLTDEQVSWMISLMYIGSLVSPLVTGMMMDRYGRKSALYLTMAQAILAWMLLSITNSVYGIYSARFIGGMVSGSGITATPIYVSEIAEPELRGGLNVMFSLMTYMGIMFEYVVGPFVSYSTLNQLSLLFVIVLTISLYFIPETPYYYTMKQNRLAAIKSLAWFRCSELRNVENELDIIEVAVTENMKEKATICDLVKSKGNKRALILTEILAIIQRMVGVSVIMAYASSAAPSSWMLTNDQCAILICLTWIVFCLLSVIMVDRYGRRVLLVISCFGCAVAQGAYGVFNYFETNTDLDLTPYDWFRFASLMGFSIFYPVGIGCIPSIIQGELFAPNIKGIASGVTTIVYALASFATNKFYQPIGSAYGYYINYWIYMAFAIIGLLFAVFLLVETKGKSLQEIHDELAGKRTKR